MLDPVMPCPELISNHFPYVLCMTLSLFFSVMFFFSVTTALFGLFFMPHIFHIKQFLHCIYLWLVSYFLFLGSETSLSDYPSYSPRILFFLLKPTGCIHNSLLAEKTWPYTGYPLFY